MQNYRPVILIGNGIRNNPALVTHLQSLGIPCLYTWMAIDLSEEAAPTYCGRPGIFGQRAANIIQQKATHLYCYGARLDGEQVAYDYDRFAPNAKKYVYDVDKAELGKFPKVFLTHSDNFYTLVPDCTSPDWLSWCRTLYDRFRPELDGCESSDKYVDPFEFVSLLSYYGEPNDVFAIGSSGNAPCAFLQAFKVKAGQRVTNVCTIGSMGADIPMAIGAALATGRRTICMTGDGGFQMNTQELEVIRRLHLPITFFVMNNNGYNSIRVAQKARFGRVTGADPASGMTLPNLEEIAHAYGIMYMSLRGKDLPNFARCFDAAPMIVEVFVDPAWQQFPRVMASTVNGELRTDDMQDMTPKIDDLKELMEW